ncbi:MAG: glycosyl transferase [Lachnospiraceae bacterium]|nr:glycosyl transferase [Bacillales bacterium]MBQ8230754.1 glycosyl transferase [Lachnospiraceae bacterium]
MKGKSLEIPRIIHYCWFGGTEPTEEVKRCIKSWEKYCPDYQIIRWDESNYDYAKYTFAKEAYERKKWAFVSDVARLDVVYQYGGIYLDTDVELVKPIDFLLKEQAFMGIERGRLVNTGLGFGARAGHKLIGENLDAYSQMKFVKDNGELNLIPCPQVTTAILVQYGFKRRDEMQIIEDIKIFSSEYFCPMLLSDGSAEITNKTISIHHYAGTWTSDVEKKGVQKRRLVYTYLGKRGLRIYDGFVLLKTKGVRAFIKRCKEIIWKQT